MSRIDDIVKQSKIHRQQYERICQDGVIKTKCHCIMLLSIIESYWRMNHMSLIINHGINKIEELERENARLFAQLMRVNSKTGRYREAIDKIKELIPIKYENEFELSSALVSIAKEIDVMGSKSE